VFCAVHRQTGRLVALKNLEHQRFPTHKFLRELRFLLSLQHPNIVTCHALEHTRTGRYLVMDYCEAGTLRSLIEADYRLTMSQSLKLVADILAGLDHAHSRGIVHCDIKPENILLSVQPKGWVARISDFGIARLSQQIASHEEMGNTGSPAYMAPERFYGQYSHTSDLYSVGILLFELLTGYRPFSGTPNELMSAHLNRPLKVPESIPEVWQPILITSLQKLSARRFRSAAEMLAALQDTATTHGLTLELASEPIYLPTLTHNPTSEAPFPPFSGLSIADLPVSSPINSLAIAPSHTPQPPADNSALFYASDRHVIWQPNILNSAPESHTIAVELPNPIQALAVRPQGCFAIAPTSVHLITATHQSPFQLEAHRVTEYEQDSLVAIEPSGRWLATITPDNAEKSTLAFTALQSAKQTVGLAPQPIHLSWAVQSRQIYDLIALDSRHVAVLSKVTGEKVLRKPNRDSYTGHTVFDIFARRGPRLGSLMAHVAIGQIHPTSTPYRLVATDDYNPQSLLLIDLKPFRITRLGLEIQPTLITATDWGYVLANQSGQIVLLDNYGQPLGQLSGPSDPTAIAILPPHGLLIASWDSHQGDLHYLNLKDAGLDLMF
jgi:serine/threonine-protein kinase